MKNNNSAINEINKELEKIIDEMNSKRIEKELSEFKQREQNNQQEKQSRFIISNYKGMQYVINEKRYKNISNYYIEIVTDTDLNLINFSDLNKITFFNLSADSSNITRTILTNSNYSIETIEREVQAVICYLYATFKRLEVFKPNKFIREIRELKGIYRNVFYTLYGFNNGNSLKCEYKIDYPISETVNEIFILKHELFYEIEKEILSKIDEKIGEKAKS